ncbi:MAG: TIGR01906 family membrane protein [Sarcina sp.]
MKIFLKNIKYTKHIKYFSFALLTFLFLIISNVIFVFNSKFLFTVFATKTDLANKLSLSLETIILDYQKIISYIRNPLIKTLNFDNFTLSSNGQVHFSEVKIIFFSLCILAFLITLFFSIYLIYKMFFYDKTKLYATAKTNITLCAKYLNVLTTLFVLILISLISFNFTKYFNYMHEILFNNTYWIFNYQTDSIINILPQEFFMFCAIVILILLVIETILINLFIKKDVVV